MEFTCLHNRGNSQITCYLKEFELEVNAGTENFHIPYASIYKITLHKAGTLFYATIWADGFKPLYVSNRILQEKRVIEQSPAYATFMRVLHFHLKKKGNKPQIRVGSSYTKIWFSGFLFVSILLFIVYFFGTMLDLPNVNLVFNILLGTLALLGLLSIVSIMKKTKEVEEYPVDYLPA